MELGELLYVVNRDEWRAWLEANHKTKEEIWLVYYNKKSGKPRIPYDDAVEEALCFGWIDSIAKKPSEETSAQRFTPRRKKSNLSELNKERIRILLKQGKMTDAGIDCIREYLTWNESGEPEPIPFDIPADLIAELKKDPEVWKNYLTFPDYYQRIRLAFIHEARSRPEVFRTRLNYFLKMTRQNKRYGTLT